MWNSNSSGACSRAKPRTTRLRRSRAIERFVWTPKRPVSTTSTSTWSASAAASTSNPGPRLAEEAGTRIRRRRFIGPREPVGAGRERGRRSRAEHGPLDRADVGLARDHGAGMAQRHLGVLEPVPGEDADHPARPLRPVAQQPRDARGGGGLADDALVRGEPPVGVEDLAVGNGADRAM